MLREERNEEIYALRKASQVSYDDQQTMIAISGVLGDEDEMDIDWDDLKEATTLPLEQVEEVLQEMYDFSILEILDFEAGYYG